MDVIPARTDLLQDLRTLLGRPLFEGLQHLRNGVFGFTASPYRRWEAVWLIKNRVPQQWMHVDWIECR
ncbi:MAG: hypothetical protein CME19_11035 [Gemmatimonadetes bacterium]|nr:hypothetical protein [Gemmatimonadota bacterium]